MPKKIMLKKRHRGGHLRSSKLLSPFLYRRHIRDAKSTAVRPSAAAAGAKEVVRLGEALHLRAQGGGGGGDSGEADAGGGGGGSTNYSQLRLTRSPTSR